MAHPVILSSKTLGILASFGFAASVLGAGPAMAMGFSASYSDFYGKTLTFDLDGVLQPDNDTIFINSITNAQWGGVPGGPTDVVLSIDQVFDIPAGGPFPPATTSISGAIQNFFTYPSVGQGGFFFRTGTFLGFTDFYGGSEVGGYGEYGPTPGYTPNNWSLRQSTPAPGPLPVMGTAAAFGFSRRLRRRIRAVR